MGGRGGAPRQNLETSIAQATMRNETPTAGIDAALADVTAAVMETPGYEFGKGYITYLPETGVLREPGDLITLLDVRKGLAKRGYDRAAQDKALVTLQRARKILLIPLAKKLAVNKDMRDAAIQMGGEAKTGLQLRSRSS